MTDMTKTPAYRAAYEWGRAMATMMGCGLRVGVRRSTEWHRRDGRKGAAWKAPSGEIYELIGSLTRARHIFEVVSSRVVIARFDRRYEADAFIEAFCRRKVRSVRGTVVLLRATRRYRQRLALAEAA